MLGVGETSIVSLRGYPATPFFCIATYHIRVAEEAHRVELARDLGPYAPLLYAPAMLLGDEDGNLSLASPASFAPRAEQTFNPSRKTTLIDLYSRFNSTEAGLQIFCLVDGKPMAHYDLLPNVWQPAQLKIALAGAFSSGVAGSSSGGAFGGASDSTTLTLTAGSGFGGASTNDTCAMSEFSDLLSEVLTPDGPGLANGDTVFDAEMAKADKTCQNDRHKKAALLVKNCSPLVERYEAQFGVYLETARRKKSFSPFMHNSSGMISQRRRWRTHDKPSV